ncbi:MAG: VCBS repeat-containing protein [Candidatus Neomarinimicrobiota bacterium]
MKVIPNPLGICLLLLYSCGEERPTIQIDTLFTLLPEDYTGLKFENRLTDETDFNVFKYRNYYNGGGVAIGDVNNDGLPDVYLVANQGSNKLFLNDGDLRFRDVTKRSGVSGTHNWSTGVCMVDINGDRKLDIYVCNSGNIKGDNRANELFLNQGNGENGVPTFVEAAGEYGIDNRGFSTHAAFFDYDRDGDLDLYVLNNAFRAMSSFNLSDNLRHERDPHGGDRLYRNDREASGFVDVSDEAGIYGSVIGFGLGVSVADINNDRWLDIYVANDFFERDYLYINNHDGTFTERLEEMIRHISLSSMGGDIADLNNDGFMDIYATDMLPEDDYRLKTTFVFESSDFYDKKIEWGYYHQLSRNVLQLSNGFHSEGHISFSEIGLLAGVAKTDWSWGSIIVDLNNDGLKDIFVSNGIFRDVTDQDYIAYLMESENIRSILRGDRIDFPELIRKTPSNRLANYAFDNNGDLTFSNHAAEWGLDIPSFSNGTAYGDLDGDGDNDLVINNVNQPAFVFRNEADSLTDNHYLRVELVGEGMNRFSVGAKVTLKCANDQIFVLEQMPMKGFQSSFDYGLTFGLGVNDRVDTLIVDWPDGTQKTVTDVATDQLVTLYQRDARSSTPDPHSDGEPVFRDITQEFPLKFRHVENEFVDFHREPLIPHKLSTEGPGIAKGDVNGDGLEDLYLGGAKGSPGRLVIQTGSGKFRSTSERVFQESKISEDVDAAFFDADGDGDLDLYVVSGGNEYSTRAPALLDRLYINDGRGNFTRSIDAIPRFYSSGSCVEPGDFDGDGDSDLFVGSRSIPWRYGLTPTSYLLQNDGEGRFSVATEEYAPELSLVGMVTDGEWIDYDNDGDQDLVVVGEWMPVTLFRNTGNRLEDLTGQVGLERTNGWWNCVVVDDLDENGYVDLVTGNLGRNSKIRATESEPATLYVSDLDRNGIIDQILCYYKLGKSYPMLLRPDLVNQLPFLKEKFPKHADYAEKQVIDIFTEEQLGSADIKKVYTFATSVFYGSEEGRFQGKPLPTEVQFSPVYAIMTSDFDADGRKDLLMAGNFYGVKPQLGRYDASYGALLSGNGAGGFASMPVRESGLSLSGQIRDIVSLEYGERREVIIFAKNDAPIQVYEFAAR